MYSPRRFILSLKYGDSEKPGERPKSGLSGGTAWHNHRGTGTRVSAVKEIWKKKQLHIKFTTSIKSMLDKQRRSPN